MKKVCFILILQLLFIAWSCADQVDPLTSEIYGEWQLTETLADPGDGSGTWQPAVNAQFIVFKRDGTFIDSANPKAKSTFLIIKKDTSMQITTNGNELNYQYRIQDVELILRPTCFEACGNKYKKVMENP